MLIESKRKKHSICFKFKLRKTTEQTMKNSQNKIETIKSYHTICPDVHTSRLIQLPFAVPTHTRVPAYPHRSTFKFKKNQNQNHFPNIIRKFNPFRQRLDIFHTYNKNQKIIRTPKSSVVSVSNTKLLYLFSLLYSSLRIQQ